MVGRCPWLRRIHALTSSALPKLGSALMKQRTTEIRTPYSHQAGGLQSGQTVLVSGAAGRRRTFGRLHAEGVGPARDRGRAGCSTRPGGQHRCRRNDHPRRPGALATIPQVDVVANAVRGKTATDLPAKVKDGRMFASVTWAPTAARTTRRCASCRSN